MLLEENAELHQLSWNRESLNNVRQRESALEISAGNSHICRTGHISIDSDLNREKMRNGSQTASCSMYERHSVMQEKQTNSESRTRLCDCRLSVNSEKTISSTRGKSFLNKSVACESELDVLCIKKANYSCSKLFLLEMSSII